MVVSVYIQRGRQFLVRPKESLLWAVLSINKHHWFENRIFPPDVTSYRKHGTSFLKISFFVRTYFRFEVISGRKMEDSKRKWRFSYGTLLLVLKWVLKTGSGYELLQVTLKRSPYFSTAFYWRKWLSTLMSIVQSVPYRNNTSPTFSRQLFSEDFRRYEYSKFSFKASRLSNHAPYTSIYLNFWRGIEALVALHPIRIPKFQIIPKCCIIVKWQKMFLWYWIWDEKRSGVKMVSPAV